MFLATTALKEFWKTEDTILFLGEWCLKYRHRKEWSTLSYKILDYPWRDRNRLSSAIEYCEDLFETVIFTLTDIMNEIHGTEYNCRYWRIILGPWLMDYIQALYDRYICLCGAVEIDYEFETIVMNKASFVTPLDSWDFHRRYVDDAYNLQLYSQILAILGYSFPDLPLVEKNDGQINDGLTRKIKNAIKKIYGRLLNSCSADGQVLLYDLHFNQFDLWRICLSSGFKAWPVVYEGKYQNNLDSIETDIQLRNKFHNISMDNDNDVFKKVLIETLPTNFPVCYLEGYERLKKTAIRFMKKDTDAIISSFGWVTNEHFKFLAAELSEKQTTLCGVQHGGATGVNRYAAADSIIAKNSDIYITWGWSDKELPRKIPLPDPVIQRLRKNDNKFNSIRDNMPILFVGTIFQRYLHYFRYCPLGPQMVEYFSWQINFFKALPDNIIKSFIIRLYPKDFDWDNKKRLSDEVPGISFDDHSLSYKKQAKRCKLIIMDNCQTTFLEALLLNRPTILFFDPMLWDVSDEAKPYMKLLQQAGILYYSPEEAANKLKNDHDRIGLWWYSEDVQQIRKEYIDYFAVSDSNWLRAWKNQIMSLRN